MATSVPGQGVGPGSEVLEAPRCQHQFVIDTPAGPSSRGVCRLCGEERQFQNYIEGSAWGYDISLEQLNGGSHFPTGRDVAPKRGLEEDE